MSNSINHARNAAQFNQDPQKVTWHDKALWHVREKRDSSAQQIQEWETLRTLASQIKAHTLSQLGDYLELFEKQALQNGIRVHWAADAQEHNQIVYRLLQKHQVSKVVKSKSMLTEECQLNTFLYQKGIQVTDTDLGERIVQLAKEPPSHIVLPAIHKTREEVGELFHRTMQTEAGNSDPTYLTKAARKDLREKFLNADAAITGVNFAVAETGEFVVCTNEGNVDLGANLPNLHIACMGIEKVIPEQKDLGVFLRLLARSATGQPITTFSSHFKKPSKGREIHLILVDNGRSEQLNREDFRSSLQCIRCGACMNTCPIYRRSGGHSYEATIPGPIGAILSPGKDLKKYSQLPFASTLCGACSAVCPVKIDIDTQLYKWRQIIGKDKSLFTKKTLMMKIGGKMLGDYSLYHFTAQLGKRALRLLPSWLINNHFNAWGKSREIPEVPVQTFSTWFKNQQHHEHKK
ncbi:lactate utilization protein B [Algivirga pacifica]|uniref:Lactate utilization protein B n=1 Tax=Algivirga pacifica TaxID=1162670 RepID=A0ABP9DGR8_9BACT